MEVIKGFKAPKLRELTEEETISSFASWKQNLEFQLASCDCFAPFIGSKFQWKSKNVTDRGLQDDEGGNNSKTAAQKAIMLDKMIGLTVGYCPVVIRLEIERKCTSLTWIWNRIRRHYGFSKSEGNFLKLATIKHQDGERYETYFQRIMAHLYDNLLSPEAALLFDGEVYNTSEEMSPSTERLAVFLWLHYIDERLPMYVARVYAHELQSMTLKDLQPVISQNMNSLLLELAAQEDIKLAYSSSSNRAPFNNRSNTRSFGKPPGRNNNNRRPGQSSKSCAFCKACKRPHLGHDVDNCWTLQRFNKSDMVKALMVDAEEDAYSDDNEVCDNFANLSTGKKLTSVPTDHQSSSVANISRVEVMKSPSFVCSYNGLPCKITVDTGATSNCVSLNLVKASGMPLVRTNQGARQLDGSQVKTCGEVDCVLDFGSEKLQLNALVIESTDADILAGVPFCKRNNIEISMSKEEIYIRNKVIKYGQGPKPRGSNIFKAESFLVRSPVATVLYPGESLDISCPSTFTNDEEVAF